MLDISTEQIIALEEGIVPTDIVTINWSWGEEDYTAEDYLDVPLGSITTSTSEEGSYEQGNFSLILLNREYYFSRLFANELPLGKLVVAYDLLLGIKLEKFRGKVTDWKLTPEKITLSIT